MAVTIHEPKANLVRLAMIGQGDGFLTNNQPYMMSAWEEPDSGEIYVFRLEDGEIELFAPSRTVMPIDLDIYINRN